MNNITHVAVEKYPDATTGKLVPIAYFSCNTSQLLNSAQRYVYDHNRIAKEYMRLRFIHVEVFNKRNA